MKEDDYMITIPHTFLQIVLIGIGATLTFDLWGVVLKHAFRIPPSNICLVGRWLLYMPGGVFTHASITAAPRKRFECPVGWIAHYLIGVTFAAMFIIILGPGWLVLPTPLPAVAFGVVTVLAPFLILQPSLGFGIAGSKTANPAQARVRTLMNHLAFGVGLYASALFISRLAQQSLFIF